MTPAEIWLDGALVPADDARVSVLSHAMQRGSLVFDVGSLRQGQGGRVRLFRAREHIARFLASAALIGLEVPFGADALLEATLATAARSHAKHALVRWSAFLALPEPDVLPREGTRPGVAIAVLPVVPPAGGSRPPLRVSIPVGTRKAGPEVFPPQAKVAASYLGPMLAKRAAGAAGYDEVVLLDREGRVAEAPTANVFAVRDGVLVTPPLERVLAGITRDTVLALARAEGIPAREAHLSPAELAEADEVFLVATSYPVQPVASIDTQVLPKAPGPFTAHMMAAVLACERGEDPRFTAWTTELG